MYLPRTEDLLPLGELGAPAFSRAACLPRLLGLLLLGVVMWALLEAEEAPFSLPAWRLLPGQRRGQEFPSEVAAGRFACAVPAFVRGE